MFEQAQSAVRRFLRLFEDFLRCWLMMATRAFAVVAAARSLMLRRSFHASRGAKHAAPVSVMNLDRDAPRGHLPSFVRLHPALWASLKSQTPSAIAALGSRFHLITPHMPEEEFDRRMTLVRVACTHPSVLSVQQTASSLPMSVQVSYTHLTLPTICSV